MIENKLMKYPVRMTILTLIATLILIIGANGFVLKESGIVNLVDLEKQRNLMNVNNIV